MINAKDIQEKGLEGFNRYYSKYLGYVADRKDPEKRGRVKLRVPQLWENQVHDHWALPVGMFAGAGKGDIVIPALGDKVWVEFAGGNQQYPLWSYGHWDTDEALSEIYDTDGEPKQRLIQTGGGHRILIDDKNNLIEIKTKAGKAFLINDNGVSIISGKISLGTKDESEEPGVLGNKNADLHDAHIDADISHTHMTAMGASSTPINLAEYQALKPKVTPTKSQKVSLD